MSVLSLDELDRCLRLAPTDDSGTFRGDNIPIGTDRVFGGQIMGQAVMAAASAAPEKSLKSFTHLFAREGATDTPVDFDVTSLHNGRTYASARVAARQGERTIGHTLMSFHTPEDGPTLLPVGDPPGSPDDARPVDLGILPWDVRIVGDVDLFDRRSQPSECALWMRAPVRADDEWMQKALLAHATDLSMIGTLLLPVEGVAQQDNGVRVHTAVTSHTMWFHDDIHLDDWLLIRQRGLALNRSRGFGTGDVFTADGRLVAAYAQESMIRVMAAG
ncbi:acyl-CoA thioesterase II [uncultured Williamsia sp.]|uniref:acyl-CoA thioesterase n=1 Tax=uncultured Williamsia sp. TaxID=259311 RepID=UPI00261D77F1|nr:acyl-CoA thioesterase domain-containing protein [uncultured Williamsia sp.]